MVEDDFPKVRTLLLNLDNGPENHSRRTQFMHRLTQLADTSGLTLQLAYYPPLTTIPFAANHPQRGPK
jgi:hypothetical protein